MAAEGGEVRKHLTLAGRSICVCLDTHWITLFAQVGSSLLLKSCYVLCYVGAAIRTVNFQLRHVVYKLGNFVPEICY